jgi:hypothetical protein
MWLEQMHCSQHLWEVKELCINHLLNMIFQFHSYQTANQGILSLQTLLYVSYYNEPSMRCGELCIINFIISVF